jgi:hypothetical protein
MTSNADDWIIVNDTVIVTLAVLVITNAIINQSRHVDGTIFHLHLDLSRLNKILLEQ